MEYIFIWYAFSYVKSSTVEYKLSEDIKKPWTQKLWELVGRPSNYFISTLHNVFICVDLQTILG